MCFCGDKFGDCVGEGGIWVYVEDGEGVLTIFHAAGRKDDGNKMNASIV